jgi:prephenate dehydrogenase
MPRIAFKQVTIIGVGLLGGSLGLAVRKLRLAGRVIGVGRREASLLAARKRRAIDAYSLCAAEGVAGSDLIVLATPVGAFERHLKAIAPSVAPGAIITDVGSTKSLVVRQAQRILRRPGMFVGSHPMAGSEQRGVDFADVNLFRGATCIVTPTPATNKAAMAKVESFWQALGMKLVRLSPAAHDRALAKVSHLPHVLASLLMLLPGEADLELAATGFRDTTRLAGGDVEVWRDIFMSNRPAMLSAVDKLDESLLRLRDLLEVGDAKEIERLLAKAKLRREKRILPRWPQ